VTLERANLDYERILKLDTIESKQTADDLRLKVEAAKVAIKEAQAQVDLNKTWTVIRSPINGVVLEKLIDANELVTPQSFGRHTRAQHSLIAIADLKDLQVEVDLNEADLAKVDLNQFCRISPEAYPDKAFEGFVAEIAPEANRQKGTLQVKSAGQRPRSLSHARVDREGGVPQGAVTQLHWMQSRSVIASSFATSQLKS
jgi:HlyD family secretion protein